MPSPICFSLNFSILVNGITTYTSSQKPRTNLSSISILPLPCPNHQQDSKKWKVKVHFEYLSTFWHHPCYPQSQPPTSFASTTEMASCLPDSLLAHVHVSLLKAEREVFLKMYISPCHSAKNPSAVSHCISNTAHLISRSVSSLRNWPLPTFLTSSHTTLFLAHYYLTPWDSCV